MALYSITGFHGRRTFDVDVASAASRIEVDRAQACSVPIGEDQRHCGIVFSFERLGQDCGHLGSGQSVLGILFKSMRLGFDFSGLGIKRLCLQDQFRDRFLGSHVLIFDRG